MAGRGEIPRAARAACRDALEAAGFRKRAGDTYTISIDGVDDAVGRVALNTAGNRPEAEQGWTARRWLSWIDPDDRPWTWWDARVVDEDRALVRVEVTGWPTPTGALEWLLRAAGADRVAVVDPPG